MNRHLVGRFHKDYTEGPDVREKPEINKLSRSLSYKSDYASTEVVDRLLAGRDKFLKAQRLGIPIVDENKPPLRKKRKRSSVTAKSSQQLSEREQFEGDQDGEEYVDPEQAVSAEQGEAGQEEIGNDEEQIQDFGGDDEQV